MKDNLSLKRVLLDAATAVLLGFVLLSLLLIILYALNSPLQPTISNGLIGTAINKYVTTHCWQRKAFFAEGQFWVFYGEGGENFGFKTSVDGRMWSNFTIIWNGPNFGDRGYHFSLYYDGDYIYTLFLVGTSHFERGKPNANGSISWGEVYNPNNLTCSYGTICVDSFGYPWIAFTALNTPWIQRAITLNGSAWEHPMQLDSEKLSLGPVTVSYTHLTLPTKA